MYNMTTYLGGIYFSFQVYNLCFKFTDDVTTVDALMSVGFRSLSQYQEH